MNITDRRQYRTKDYREYGFQRIVLDSEIYELINKVICGSHEYANETHANIYSQKAQADRVRKSEPFEEGNRYVFISRLGRPLRSDIWNRKLREIFADAGIGLDTQVRKHNLNHRFRHGFAMYQVKHMGRNELELMRMMRHTSLKSVEMYFKPTIQDQIELKREFAEELMKSIPGLKRIQEA
jgi:integrase/recombinase XerD